MEQTIAAINDKIIARSVRVMTLTELQKRMATVGLEQVATEVDVITTGTFAPIESAGVFINLGHTDPPSASALVGLMAYLPTAVWEP